RLCGRFASGAVGIECERNSTRAVADGCRRRFASANSIQAVFHYPGPTAHIITRGSERFIPSGPDDLDAVTHGGGPDQRLLCSNLALTIGTRCRECVTGLIEEHNAAGRTESDEGVVFNFAFPDRVAGHRRDNFGFLSRNVATQIESMKAQIQKG